MRRFCRQQLGAISHLPSTGCSLAAHPFRTRPLALDAGRIELLCVKDDVQFAGLTAAAVRLWTAECIAIKYNLCLT